VFDVAALNPELYQKSHALKELRTLRRKLFLLKDFVITCRGTSSALLASTARRGRGGAD
jgi:hypothetical protein